MAKKPWSPLDLSSLVDCMYLACDPSLTALGVVLLEVYEGDLFIQQAEKLSTVPTEKKGWEDTFYRAELMEALLSALIDSWEPPQGSVGVHEAPPIGKNMARTESTILTGYGFRSVMTEYGIPLDPAVTAQSHKRLICGNHLATKREHHEELKKLLPRIKGAEKITNEATRDALSIGLYAAHRLSEGL